METENEIQGWMTANKCKRRNVRGNTQLNRIVKKMLLNSLG